MYKVEPNTHLRTWEPEVQKQCSDVAHKDDEEGGHIAQVHQGAGDDEAQGECQNV